MKELWKHQLLDGMCVNYPRKVWYGNEVNGLDLWLCGFTKKIVNQC